LTDYEVDLVAGGWGSSSNWWGEAVVTAYQMPDLSWAFDVVPYTDGGGNGGGSTPSTEDAAHQQTDDADNTPCVDEVPTGVDLPHLNDLAKHMGSVLANCQDLTDWEWGAFIYQGSDGQLYQSEPFTGGHYDNMEGASITLPPGAHIVAYLHTHPEDSMMDERTLSSADRSFITGLIDSSNDRWSADSKLLAYVVTKDESTSYHTYVYDKSNRNRTSPGCDL
jgi:hypothetical protein